MDFYSLIYRFESMGVYDYFLPFLLVFIVIFAILEKTYLFGSVASKAMGDRLPKSNINAILAIVLALMVISNTEVIYLMNQYLTRVTFFIVLAVTFMLIVALFTKPGDNDKLFNGFEMSVAVVIAFVGLFYSLQSTAYGDIIPLWFFYINEDLLVFILGLVALFAIIAWVVKSPETL